MLQDKIHQKESKLLFYSLTPPKITNEVEKIQQIAKNQMERLSNTPIDGLILYDIQEEAERTNLERPFAFISTVKPETYATDYLEDLKVPKIIYKSIANIDKTQFEEWLKKYANLEYLVLVGASSQQQVLKTNFTLDMAYEICSQQGNPFVLGGVTIPERHMKKQDEHLRIFNKVDKGCKFFVSQCVYSPNHAKNFLSDYYYASLEGHRTLYPMIFTLAPCGSLKTLQFMEWLGIDVPKWLYNDLKHSENILDKSVKVCKNIAEEMLEYAYAKNIPIGFNIESVSIKKEEIIASTNLLSEISGLLSH